jgi:hypothetical protein
MDGRLRPAELYIDAGSAQRQVEAGDLRNLPLPLIEAVVNEHGARLRFGIGSPSPDLSTLASYYGSGFSSVWPQVSEGNWVVASFASQFLEDGVKSETDPGTGARIMRVPKARREDDEVDVEQEFRLEHGPAEGLTDDFLRDVARAYRAALARGERPNKSIADHAGESVRTVQRWVYTARQRKIMPPGKKGSAG